MLSAALTACVPAWVAAVAVAVAGGASVAAERGGATLTLTGTDADDSRDETDETDR